VDQPQDRTEEVLSWLLDGANDALQTLRQASELARNPSLRSFFLERAEEGEQLAAEIRSGLTVTGPIVRSDDGTVVGVLHRVFAQGRNLVSGDSDKAVVEEAARGAALAENRFAAVADDERIPNKARAIASRAIGTLKAQREALDELRGQYA
jgi:uncharacterized protein (TIGR02284 family)